MTDLLKKLTKALSYKYPNDRMMPGVTVSHLRNGDAYVSLIRWTPDKTIVYKVQNPDLDFCLKQAARFLVNDKRETNPLDELNEALSPLPAWPCPDPHAYSVKDPVSLTSDELLRSHNEKRGPIWVDTDAYDPFEEEYAGDDHPDFDQQF